MPTYLAFAHEPVDLSEIEGFDPDEYDSLDERTTAALEAVGLHDAELYYTTAKYFGVVVFEATDNAAAEEVVRRGWGADARVEVVPALTAAEIESRDREAVEPEA